MSTEYPRAVIAAVNAATDTNPQDIGAAVADAVRRVRELPEYATVVDQLVNGMIQELVYGRRHHQNVSLKNQTRQYGEPAKVTAASKQVQDAHRSTFDYFLAGRRLGDMFGEELPAVAQAERERASGHEFNARLCEELRKKVADGKRVREAYSEAQLSRLFARLQGARPAAATA